VSESLEAQTRTVLGVPPPSSHSTTIDSSSPKHQDELGPDRLPTCRGEFVQPVFKPCALATAAARATEPAAHSYTGKRWIDHIRRRMRCQQLKLKKPYLTNGEIAKEVGEKIHFVRDALKGEPFKDRLERSLRAQEQSRQSEEQEEQSTQSEEQEAQTQSEEQNAGGSRRRGGGREQRTQSEEQNAGGSSGRGSGRRGSTTAQPKHLTRTAHKITRKRLSSAKGTSPSLTSI
jgi:hypothetical protein